MAKSSELDRCHAFWLGALFVSPPLRQVVAPDGRHHTLSRHTMRLLVALAQASSAGVGAARLQEQCALEPAGYARAIRRLRRLAAGLGRGSFRLVFEGTHARLTVIAVADPPRVPQRRRSVRGALFGRAAAVGG